MSIFRSTLLHAMTHQQVLPMEKNFPPPTFVQANIYNFGSVTENRVFHQQPPAPCMPTSRAVPLPPPILHNRPSSAIPLSVKYNYYSPPPPPPDVTVFSSKNFLTTFAHKADETEGHLVWRTRRQNITVGTTDGGCNPQSCTMNLFPQLRRP